MQMTPEQHEHWRKRLEDEERNLLAELGRTDDEYLGSVEAQQENPDDSAARAWDESSKDTTYQLEQRQRDRLDAVHDAQQRLERNEFGVCANCQEDIDPRRLELVPWTQLCVRCESEAH